MKDEEGLKLTENDINFCVRTIGMQFRDLIEEKSNRGMYLQYFGKIIKKFGRARAYEEGATGSSVNWEYLKVRKINIDNQYVDGKLTKEKYIQYLERLFGVLNQNTVNLFIEWDSELGKEGIEKVEYNRELSDFRDWLRPKKKKNNGY